MAASGKGKGKKKEPNSPFTALTELERIMGGAAQASGAAAQAAQDLIYDAWNESAPEEATNLIMQALELDPRNVDGLSMVAAAWQGEDDEEYERMLQEVIAVAVEDLGEEIFTEGRGHFWGILETRPYMRVRAQLIDLLFETGRTDDAINECREMLELCPNDNLGLRYNLLAGHLMQNQQAEARRLLEAYPEEKPYSAIMSWGAVLERYLAGDLEGAAVECAAAQKQNRYVAAYLKGHRKLPRTMPEGYSLGSREEALCCVDILGPAWEAHPFAVAWLKTQDN